MQKDKALGRLERRKQMYRLVVCVGLVCLPVTPLRAQQRPTSLEAWSTHTASEHAAPATAPLRLSTVKLPRRDYRYEGLALGDHVGCARRVGGGKSPRRAHRAGSQLCSRSAGTPWWSGWPPRWWRRPRLRNWPTVFGRLLQRSAAPRPEGVQAYLYSANVLEPHRNVTVAAAITVITPTTARVPG
jgi:hypothetical protein